MSSDKPDDNGAAEAWRARAPELAEWAWAHLVNRVDIWGGYLPMRYRKEKADKSVTKPRKTDRGKVLLSPAVLERHFNGRDVGDVAGLHTTSSSNTSRWFVVEIDKHDGDPGADAEVNWYAALYWFAKLVSLGFDPILTDSNGKGGYHLRVIFAEPVPTPRVFTFAQWLVADHEKLGLASAPETFPKQAKIEPDACGNFVRLPGRHHTHDHWSAVYSEATGDWLTGADAIAEILRHQGDDPALLPGEAAVETPPPKPAARPRPATPHPGQEDDQSIARRCLARIPNNGCDYHEWLAIGMALHATGCDLADWKGWSAQCADKHDDATCEKKWNSFSEGRGKKVTIATLIKRARDAGYEPYPKRDRPQSAPGAEAQATEPDETPDDQPPSQEEARDPAEGDAALEQSRERVRAAVQAAEETESVAKLFEASADFAALPTGEMEDFLNAIRKSLGRNLNVRLLRREIDSKRPRKAPRVIETDRPKLNVNDTWFNVVRETARVLSRANHPPKRFERTAVPTRITEDEHGKKLIVPITETFMRGDMGREINYFAISEKKGEVDAPPPLDVAKDLCQRINETLEQIDERPYPPLLGLVETPVLRADGTILETPGYDVQTGLYYSPARSLEVPPIPKRPTAGDVKASLDCIREMIGDFPYESETDLANAHAAVLTPVVRMMVGLAPIAVVDAPQAGTGKSLFASAIYAVATGKPGTMTSIPESDDEMRKLITAALLEGATVMLMDNLDGALFHPSLAKAITAQTWSDRKLGVTQTVSVPQLATWIVTGNNVTLGGDLPRRCYRVRLDAKSSKPWDDGRQFLHDDLIPWVLENRGRIIAALLTLCRAWFAAGRPRYDVPRLGSFEHWSHTVGSVLAHAGIKGFLANRDEVYAQADEDGPQWELFLTVWRDKYGERAITTATIEDDVPRDGQLRDALPDALSGFIERHQGMMQTEFKIKEAGRFKIRLGKALKQRLGRRFGPLNLYISRGSDTHARVATWTVKAAPVGGGCGSAGSCGSQSDPSHAGNHKWRAHEPANTCAPHEYADMGAPEPTPATTATPADPYEEEERAAIQEVDAL